MNNECRTMMYKLKRLMENLVFPTNDYYGSDAMKADLKYADEIVKLIYDKYEVSEEKRAKKVFSQDM